MPVRHCRVPLLGLAVALPALSAAAMPSGIDSVTLYPGGLVEIDRVAAPRYEGGAGEFVFTDLPAGLQSGSVRVSLESGDARLGAIEVAREPVGEPPRERERALREQMDRLEAQRRAALDRVAAARTQITFIEGLARLPQGEGAAAALTAGEGAERWAALWERIGKGSRSAHEELRDGERAAARHKAEIETLQAELDRLGEGRREVVRVAVPYTADAAGIAKLRLAYRVRGPRWEPRYETRLDTASGRLELVRGARIRQATGEDWVDVRVRLSSVRPVQGERPEPTSWWIDLAPPASGADRAGEAMLATDGARAAADAALVGTAFAATWEVPGRVTVPAGNQPRELLIATDELDAAVGARVFPQQDRRAWLTASVVWPGPGPLPPGSVSRFRDGAFVGRGRLAQWSPGESRDLSFGVDPDLDVRFEPLRDEAGEAGWITTRSTLARRYHFEITNRHERPLPVTALFRVPVPRDEAITVETAFSRPPTINDLDQRRGVHAWKIDLGAGGTESLRLGYSVSYPEGRTLRGL